MNKFKENPKSSVSLVVPAYNEAPIAKKNLTKLCQYMESLEDEYKWELIVVNDGSTDKTGKLAEDFAKGRSNVSVFHHTKNLKLGQALQTAFRNCGGDYIVTMDIDLSYSPDHIGRLLNKIRETEAKIVTASPFRKGGCISNVPLFRRILSQWANKFLSISARGFNLRDKLWTFTGLVRAYDSQFLNTLNLKAKSMDINVEIIFKSMLLQAGIEEIPAHLNWKLSREKGIKRKSSLKLLPNIISCLKYCFTLSSSAKRSRTF